MTARRAEVFPKRHLGGCLKATCRDERLRNTLQQEVSKASLTDKPDDQMPVARRIVASSWLWDAHHLATLGSIISPEVHPGWQHKGGQGAGKGACVRRTWLLCKCASSKKNKLTTGTWMPSSWGPCKRYGAATSQLTHKGVDDAVEGECDAKEPDNCRCNNMRQLQVQLWYIIAHGSWSRCLIICLSAAAHTQISL